MLGLIPAELWDYDASDCLRGLADAAVAQSRDKMLFIAGVGNCVPTRSARAALVTAVKALALPANARIAVPLYCCAVVLKAIRAAGCTPRFIDVEPETFCMSPADLRLKASEVDAVIAVHMFGNVCNVEKLRVAITGKPIIEDCALSLGSGVKGRATGTLGDIAVFSFRSGKYLSVGEGGAIYSGNKGLLTRCDQIVATLPRPSRKAEVLHVVKTYLRSALRSEPLYGLIGHRLWRAYNRRAAFSEKSPVVEEQIFCSDLALIRSRLSVLDGAVALQRRNADYLIRTLADRPEVLRDSQEDAFLNRYQVAITLPSSEQRDALATYLHGKGIDSSRPVHDIVEVATAHFGYQADCPVAERLSRTALVVPTYHTLSERQLEYIARCLREGLSVISASSVHRTYQSRERSAHVMRDTQALSSSSSSRVPPSLRA